MKKMIAVLLMLGSAATFAQSFSMNLNCEVVYGVRGNCQVINRLQRPINCQVQANGQTQSGAWVNLWGRGVVYPGRVAWVTVQANNPYIDPLLFVQARANCYTL